MGHDLLELKVERSQAKLLLALLTEHIERQPVPDPGELVGLERWAYDELTALAQVLRDVLTGAA